MKKLIGKWQMVCWKIRTADGWQMLSRYREKEYDWEFRPGGILIERAAGQEPILTIYCYNPIERLLLVDCSDYTDDGYLFFCSEDRYRVDFLSDKYFVLYDLGGVKVEPDDYVLKLEMEKV